MTVSVSSVSAESSRSPVSSVSPAPQQPVFGLRLAVGLLGVLLAAMVAGLNNRVPGLVLADLQGVWGFGLDDASWLNTAYAAGELAAMPFAPWFAVTFSMRRFHLAMLGTALLLAALIPAVHDLHLLLALRAVQGLCSGALIPILMMAALRFLPLSVRLHGLALYAMTATFAPNVAFWLAAQFVDGGADWRWIYWHVVPLGLLAMVLVAWGIPAMQAALPRLRQANWLGLLLGLPGLALLVVALDQGVRLDWLNSPLIAAALLLGLVFTALFLVSEWRHAAPFMRLQLLGRRNLGLGFCVFFCLLVTMSAAVGLPTTVLAHVQGFRVEQIVPLGLIVGLPQVVFGPLVALLLYRRRVDARHVFAVGLALIATACWLGSRLTDVWMVEQFWLAALLQALGQPMAVIALLFLATSVVQPAEGPFVAGIVNTLRALGTVSGGAIVGQLMTWRTAFHADMLLDQAALTAPRLHTDAPGMLAAVVARQAGVLAAADVYRLLAVLALLLIPVVLVLQRIPAPQLPSPQEPLRKPVPAMA